MMSTLRRSIEPAWWIASALTYAAVAWLLAPQLLVGPLEGSDWPNALAFADWIARSFPAMPFWFPYQGAGVSPSSGYAATPLYVVALLHRAGVDLVVAGRLCAFASMVLGALGVAAAARCFGVSRAAALVAGGLWLLPPANWNLLVRIGFFSNAAVAAIFPWALAALVTYARAPRSRLDRRGVALFVAAVALCAGTFLAHPIVGVVPLALGAIVATWTSWRAIGRIVFVAMASGLAAAGALVAFLEYSRATNAFRYEVLTPEVLRLQTIPVEVLLGQMERAPNSGLLDGMSLTPLLLVLAGIGAVLAIGRPLLWTLVGCTTVAAVYMFSVENQIGVVTAFPPLSPLAGFRGWLVFLLVGMAILGATALDRIARAAPRLLSLPAMAGALIVALVALEGFGYGVHPVGEPSFLRARLPEVLAGRDGRIKPGDMSSLTYDVRAAREAAAQLDSVDGRADLSPRLGSLYKGLPLVSDARLVSLYTFQLSLVHQSWADQQQALYLVNEYGVAGASVDEISAWFGIERVALAGEDDRTRFQQAGWTLHESEGIAYADPPAARALAAHRERGTVLHVGRAANETYRNTYRLASAGGLPFAMGWLVEGPACIDDMSAAELASFDVLILEDHCERDPAASAAKIARYVEEGGRLFIETGWEWSRYNRVADAPAFLPADALGWRGVGAAPSLTFDPSFIGASGVAVRSFGDFAYEGGTWNVSTGALRREFRPVLSADGAPLIAAANLGRGRVVWSGMNLVSHARAKQSAAERDLYRAIMRWLLDGATAPRELEVMDLTESGGTVATPSAGWLLWREPPAFAALAPPSTGRYSAGPGFLLTRVQPGRYRIEQQPSALMRAAALTGGVASLALLTWAALGLRYGGAADPAAIFAAIARAARRRVDTLAGPDDEEDEAA